jgi:hypothetical protein
MDLKADIPNEYEQSGVKYQQHRSEEFLLAEYKHLADSFRRNEDIGEKRVNFLIVLVTAVITALITLANLPALAGSDFETLNIEDVDLLMGFALLALLLLGIVTLQRMLHRNRVTDEYKRAMDMIRSLFRDWDQRIESYRPFVEMLRLSIHSGFQRALDEGKSNPVALELRQEFEKANIALSKNAQVGRRETGKKWLIKDKDTRKTYLIKKEGEKLNVYRPRKLGTGGLAEMGTVINSLVVAGLCVLLARFCSWPVGAQIGVALAGFIIAVVAQCRYMKYYYER